MSQFKLTPIGEEETIGDSEFTLTPADEQSTSQFRLTPADEELDITNEPSTDEGWAKELGEGVLEGLTKIPQGIIELGLEAIDYVADTQNARQFNLWADKTRKDFGLDPEGAVGAIASGLTQFAVPGLGAAALVSKLSKLGKLERAYRSGRKSLAKPGVKPKQTLTKTQKVALATQQAVAAGVADAVVTTDGTQTIGDFFDGGFTGTDVYNVADSGSEDAARRIGNRFSLLIEGGLLAGTIPPVLSGLAKGAVKAGAARVPGTTITGADVVTLGGTRAIRAGAEKATKYVAKLDELDMRQGLKDEKGRKIREMTSFENFAFFVARNLRSRGALLGARTGVQEQETNRLIKLYDKTTKKEILFNGEKKAFSSEREAYAAFKRMTDKEAKDLDEWKNLEYDRMRNADDDVINSEILDAQNEIVQKHFLTREGQTFTKSRNITKGILGTEETIDSAKLFSLIGPAQEAAFKVATDQFQRLEKAIDEVLKKPKYLKQSKLTKEKILNNLYDYFTGKTLVSEKNLIKEVGIPKELLIPIQNMVKLKNNLAQKILNSGALQNLKTTEDLISARRGKKVDAGGREIKGPDGKPIKVRKDPTPKYVYAGANSADEIQYPPPPKGYQGTKQQWQEEWLDSKFLEFKKTQGTPIKEDIIRSIEESIIKPDGTHKKGFFVTRYRIMEDNNYKLTDDTINNVLQMFGYKFGKEGLKVDPVTGKLENIEFTGLATKGKQMFDKNTMQRMYLHMAKTFKPRRDELIKTQEDLSFEGRKLSQADQDELDLLTYDAQVGKEFDAPTADQVKKYIDLVYDHQKQRQKIARSNTNKFFVDSAIQKIPTTLINNRQIDLPTIKEIFGEVKNLKEAYVGTITKFAQFNATDTFYSSLRKIADEDIAKNGKNSIFRNTNEMTDFQYEQFLKSDRGGNSYILGRQSASGKSDDLSLSETPFGAMHGIAIPTNMWKSMSNMVVNDTNNLGHVARQIYGKFLWLKGFSQYSKTILSPITHVRNVTSASLFALAQGNVGRGANLGESLRYVSNDILGRSDEEQVAFLADLQKRGIIGSQAELRELQANLRKGVGYENPKTGDGSNLTTTANDSNMIFNLGGKFTRAGGKFLKKMEDAYKGEDDIWKIYNYQFELNKLKTARARYIASAETADQAKAFTKEFDQVHLGGKSMEDFAGDIVRNHVPNYDLTSEAIKSFRQLPVGNFVSFPAEIIRTGFNTLETAVKELSSNIPEVREIGMRRLMGSLTTFIALPITVREVGMSLSGTSEEEMQAVQDLAAPFQKNSTLVPVGRDKNGNLEIYDFSHTNPYDVLVRPFTALLRSLDRDGKLGRDGVETVLNAAEESFGEIFQPFFDESIITAKILDISPKTIIGGRGGETETGARIYKTGEGGDSLGTKFQKSFIHVLEGMTPGASPFRVPTGAEFDDIEMGRFLRGITNPESKEPSTGREYTRLGEMVRATLGVNTQVFDPDRLGIFKAQEFKANRSTAATLFNRVNNRAVVTSEEFIKAWTDANRARLRSFRKARKDFLGLQALGATEEEVIERFKKEGVGNREIQSIIQNRFIPFFPSRDAFIEAEEKGHNIPEDELEELYNSFDGIPIDPIEETEEVSELTTQEPVQKSEPVTTNVPSSPVVSTPQVSPVARDINTRLATLLNPNDRIIAERQQRNKG